MPEVADDRKKVVAKFLKSEARYLKLGLEVEAGLRHLRDEANKVVTSGLKRELKGLESESGWRLTDRSACWVFSQQDRGWTAGRWSGVWLWRPSAGSLDFTVGVQGWPASAANIRSALEGAFRRASLQHLDAWSPHPDNVRWTNEIQWQFRRGNQFLGNDPELGIQQIVALVRALLEAADSP